jgi:hypothetical protein
MAGVTGRLNLAEGFSLLGGISIVNFGLPGASASGITGAGALRYVQPDMGGPRFFGEAGAQIGAMQFALSREYDDGLSLADPGAGGTGDGYLAAVHARGGVILTPVPDNELVLSASIKQTGFNTSTFVEADPLADSDPFTADLSGTGVGYTTVKIGADWSAPIVTDVELTGSLGVGTTMGNSGVSADVFGVSDITGDRVESAPGSNIFASYGLRLAWTPSPGAKVDGFVQGTTGTGIGTHAQIGAGYRMSF